MRQCCGTARHRLGGGGCLACEALPSEGGPPQRPVHGSVQDVTSCRRIGRRIASTPAMSPSLLPRAAARLSPHAQWPVRAATRAIAAPCRPLQASWPPSPPAAAAHTTQRPTRPSGAVPCAALHLQPKRPKEGRQGQQSPCPHRLVAARLQAREVHGDR
jgi:hypothetical protein